MPNRVFILLITCILLTSLVCKAKFGTGFGYYLIDTDSEYYNSYKTTMVNPDSIAQTDTSNSITKAEPQVKDKGFLEKLFSSATKEEKAAQKEARTLSNINKKLTRIYAWHPYWMKNTHKNYKYNLLTTVSYFAIDAYLDSTKNIIKYDDHKIAGKVANEFFNIAARAGCRIDVTFKCQEGIVIDSILNYKNVQDSCIKYLQSILCLNYKYDGVCVSFENIPTNNSASYLAFISALKHALKESNRSLKITLPPVDFLSNYDILKLNSVVDEYILMGYNYYGKNSRQGPVAPLEDNKQKFHLKRSVKDYLNEGLPYAKFIVTLPYYGVVWEKNKDEKEDYKFYKNWSYSQIQNHLKTINPEIQFDSLSCTYFYDFEDKGKQFRCYYDNDKSLVKKYNWLIKEGIAGVGFWALGFDQGSQDFWNMINENFYVEKLNPLKKIIDCRERKIIDTSFICIQICDSIIIHRGIIKDTIIRDTLFIGIAESINDPCDTTQNKDLFTIYFEKFKTKFEPLYSNQRVAFVICITLILFGLAGLLLSLLFGSVREALYIRSIPQYIFINMGFIICVILLFSFLRIIKPGLNTMLPEHYNQVKYGLWVMVILGWVLVNLLSYKLLRHVSLKNDNP